MSEWKRSRSARRPTAVIAMSRSVVYSMGAPAGTTLRSTFAGYPVGCQVPRVMCRTGFLFWTDQAPCATQSRTSSRCCNSVDSAPQSLGALSPASLSSDWRRSMRLRMFCRVTARRPSAVDSRSAVYVMRLSSCSIAAKTVTTRPTSRRSRAGSLCVLSATGMTGGFMTPNVRVKPAPTV